MPFAMTNEDLKQLLANKTILDFQTDDQDFQHGLRLVLVDKETGEMGVLAVEPVTLAFEDKPVLWYSYEEFDEGRFAPSPEHWYSIDTLGRDDKSNVPFLSNEQAGLF
jgi:hypothetical protein